ncbi:MAG: ChuX/HutX family heme-like substrate-binding protein [Flavobacteriales bacterium]
METMTTTLKQRWDELQRAHPMTRIRNAARMLGVSEVELLATRIGDGVTRLNNDHRGMLGEVHKLGRVMALTRNNDVVHERKGIYLNPTINPGPVGLFVGADIDLRIFWGPWASAFSVMEPGKDAPRYSLQFFGSDGEAIHKIYLLPESDAGAFHDIVERFRDAEQRESVEVKPWPAEPAERPDEEVDTEAFRAEWLAMKDTHDFYGMVRKHRLTRTQALRLAPSGGYAVPVSNDAMRAVLTSAADHGVPIMVFVGNKGMIQIHTGEVKKLMDVPEWFNVLDPDFNLHVREAAITSSWIVRKPTVDGIVTALECFDEKGEQIVQFFGKRKPGIPELKEWQELVADVEARLRSA